MAFAAEKALQFIKPNQPKSYVKPQQTNNFFLSGYHAISNRHDKPVIEEEEETEEPGKRAFDMPELLHNLNILVDMAEEEIIANDRR